MNKNSRIIKILVILFVILISFNNVIFAEINADTSSGLSTIVFDAVEKAGKLVVNSSFAGLASLATVLAVGLFMIIYTIFSSLAGAVIYPFPDTIVFNKIALFDPNFTSPDTYSIAAKVKTTLFQMFNSFVTIALAVFAIAAMIIGIKLAISTIATEKAKYKEAITKWVTGIVLLFTLRFIIAGIFYINEQIVVSIANATEEVAFDVSWIESVPIFGRRLELLFGDTKLGDKLTSHPTGYTGLVIKTLFQGIGGNLIGALTAFIILGQTIALIIMYFKRVFYAMLLRCNRSVNCGG